MKHIIRLIVVAVTAVVTSGAHAATSADEAKQLGTALTPWGAEKAGNNEGTIPAYIGEPVKKPTSYDPKKPGQKPDPFGEKSLFSITAQNYTKYADKLDGSIEMFKRFPNYRMDIYPTHRSWVYPKYVIDNTLKNATACKAINNENTLDGCYGGFPFPIPKTGKEAMWNHLTQFETSYSEGLSDSYITTPRGDAVLQVHTLFTQAFPFYDPARTTPVPSTTLFWKIRTADISPARQAGGSTVLLDPLDWTKGGRRAYQYIPGQRRVKLAPDLAYDTPSPYAGGGQTMDDQKGFMGAMDRFDFKLIGKKEKYIPYNTFGMFDFKTCTSEKIASSKNFAHPDCVRWELHRVWVIEATLKPGFRHIYQRRVFFWDEDVPGSGTAENYDAAGAVFRITSTLSMPYYETPGSIGGSSSASISTDLNTGVAAASQLAGCPEALCGQTPIPSKPDGYFSPEVMAGSGVR